jgi:hypothetical protein
MFQRFKAYKGIAAVLEWFYLHEVVFEYLKSIFTCMEITHKEYNLIRRKPQGYFTLFEEYAGRHKLNLSWQTTLIPLYLGKIKRNSDLRRKDRDVTTAPYKRLCA